MAIKSWMGGILVVHRILSQRLLAWSLQSLIRLKEFVKLKLYSSDYFFCSRMVIMSSGRPCLMWHHPLLYATNLHTCCLRRCHVKICSRIRLQRFVSFQSSWFENLHSIRSLVLKMGHLIMTRFTLWTNRRFCLEGLLSRLVIVVLEILDTYDIWSPDPMFFSVAAICVQPAHKLRKDEVVTRKVLNPGMCLMSKSHEKVWNTDLYHIFKPYSTLTGQRHGSASNLEWENSKQLYIKWNSCFGSS